MFVPLLMVLGGCIFHLDSSGRGSSYDGYYAEEIWIASAYVDCIYVGEVSEWYLEAHVESAYGHYDSNIDVTVYIDGWDWYWTDEVGLSWWSRTFVSSYYSCHETHEFYFVAQDIYGNENYASVYW